MKRIIILIVAALVPVISWSQAQINTKKAKIEDFTEKTTKVVMTGNMFFDQVFMEEIRNRWRISAYEFCTLQEFESLKTDPAYYFLMVVKGQFRKESAPGISMLSVLQGGPAAAKGLNKMLDIVDVPLMSVEDPSGREFVFLPALLDILQEHILNSMETDVAAYSGLSNYTMQISSADKMNIVFAEEDLSATITEAVRDLYFKDGMTVTDADTVDEMMEENVANTLLSFTVCPTEQKPGSACYKMLIDAGSHKLYYFRKHRITKKLDAGFQIEDIRRIAGR